MGRDEDEVRRRGGGNGFRVYVDGQTTRFKRHNHIGFGHIVGRSSRVALLPIVA